MRVVIQRVNKASVKEKGKVKAQVGLGLLLYLAIGRGDTKEDLEGVAEKIAKLRLFEQEGKEHDFQRSVVEVAGEILVIPNYTLYGDLTQGNRPFFGEAESMDRAKDLYEYFLLELAAQVGEKVTVKTGTFGALMQVQSLNFGPATLMLTTDW